MCRVSLNAGSAKGKGQSTGAGILNCAKPIVLLAERWDPNLFPKNDTRTPKTPEHPTESPPKISRFEEKRQQKGGGTNPALQDKEVTQRGHRGDTRAGFGSRKTLEFSSVVTAGGWDVPSVPPPR